MSQHTVNHLGDLDLHGNLALVSQVTEFPLNPRLGTMVMKNNCMYVYILVGNLETWYPYATATASYIHSQGLAAQTWTVNHYLNSQNLWFQVKDENGNILSVNKTDINLNTFTLNFTAPTLGTVIVVAPEKLDVPQIRTTGLIVGANEEVMLDSGGVRVNGIYLPTEAVMTMVIANEATLRANADTTLTSNLASEVTRAQSAEATLTTSIATEASNRVAGDAALQGQIDSILSNVDATALNSLSEIVTAFQAADGSLDGAITTLSGSVTTGLEGKVDKVAGKGLSTEDYSTAEKTKLAGIAEGAQVNVVTSVAAKTGDVTLVKADVGLANVDNTSDASKPVSSATQAELDKKVDKIAGKGLSSEDFTLVEKDKLAGIALGAQVNTVTSVAGKTGEVTLSKSDVGLANVDNTSDASKPVSTAMQTALDAKEGTIAAGTNLQYYRGDKTWQTLPTYALTGQMADGSSINIPLV